MGGDTLSGSSGTSVYEPESDEWEDVDDDDDDDVPETEEDVLEHDLHNVEDIETSDEDWEVANNNLRKFKEAREVEAQRAAAECRSEVRTACENDSEYEESDAELDTPPTTDEEDNMILRRRKKTKRVKIDEHTDYKKLTWEVGMTFGTMEKFKEAVIRFALAQGYDLTFSVSDSKRRRVGAVCRSGCKFKLFASWEEMRATYVVKTVINHHVCTRDMRKNRQLKSSWVANYYLMKFKDNPHWSAKDIINTVKVDFGIVLDKRVAYRVRHAAYKLLHGSMKDHYCKLGRYIEELKRSNTSSSFILQTSFNSRNDIPIFQRFFVCFDGLKRGFLTGCRPLLCIDASFLKTFLGGTLISAVAIDGNNQMFPVAWAVAEGENNDSWTWFLNNVKTCIGATDGKGLTLVSDQHKVCCLLILLTNNYIVFAKI